MMKLNKQEKLIKTKMSSYEPVVDTGALWDSLSDYVPKKKKRKFGFYFMLIAGIAIIILAGLLINDTIPESTNKTMSANTNIVSKTENNKPIDKLTNTIKTIEDFSLSENEKSKNEINKISKANNVEKSGFNSSEKQEINIQSISEKSIVDVGSSNINSKVSTDLNIGISIDNTIRSIYKHNKTIVCSHLHILKLMPIEHKLKNIRVSKTIIIPKSAERNRFIWNLGIGFGYNNYGVASNNENISYSKYLNSIAKSKPELNLKLGVNYKILNRFYIGSGILLQRYVTQLNPQWSIKQNEEVLTENGLIQRITKYKEYSAIGYNYHYSIDIPINIGIVLHKTQRYNIAIESGVLPNIWTYSKGVVLNNEKKLYNYTLASEKPYNNFSLGWQSSFVINYNINNNYILYIQPGIIAKKIKYNIDNIFIQESFKTFNLNVGLKFKS